MTAEPWPELPWTEWKPTLYTLHMWLHVVGKVRLALTPPLNHWWHTTLYVTSRGLTTSPIPFGSQDFQVDLDFIHHRLDVADTEGGAFAMTLAPMPVATFYREFMAGLRGMGIEVRIWTNLPPARLIETAPGTFAVRLENFAVRNRPDPQEEGRAIPHHHPAGRQDRHRDSDSR